MAGEFLLGRGNFGCRGKHCWW